MSISDINSTSISRPAESGGTITPSDSADLAKVTRAIFIGGAGSLDATLLDGTRLTFANLSEGSIYALRLKKVWAAGTTATNIIGLY